MFGSILTKRKIILKEVFDFYIDFWYILDTCQNLAESCNIDSKPNTISNQNILYIMFS